MGRAYWDVEFNNNKLGEDWNSRANQFENAFRREMDQSGVAVDTNAISDYYHAWVAGQSIRASHEKLTKIRDELKRVELADLWRGPASAAFGEILTSFTAFLDEIIPTAIDYETNTIAVHENHKVPYTGFDPPAFRQYLETARESGVNGVTLADVLHSAYWYDYRTEHYVEVYGAAEQSGRPRDHYWNVHHAIGAVHEAAVEYQQRVDAFFGHLTTYFANEVTRLEKARDLLSAQYLDLYRRYERIPMLGPDFAAATRLVDPDAGDDDKISLDLGGLDRAFDGLSDGLNNLLGGSPGPGDLGAGLGAGPGGAGGLGDMPGLSGGGSSLPGLGGMPEGSGLGDPLGGLGGSGAAGLPLGGGLPELGPSGAGGSGVPLVPGALVPGSTVPLVGGGTGRVVTNPDGSKGIDIDGDGRADVGLDAVDSGGSGGGLSLVTGPDGTVGYDLTGNGNPDLAPDLHPLQSGDLPPGSALVVGADGSRAIDIDGDGIPDVTVDGRAIPGTAAPGGRLATGPDGVTGFDLDGDGIPDVGFDGAPLSSRDQPMPDPDGLLPSQQMSRPGDALPGQPATPMAGGGYPMMPFMPGMGMGMGGMGGGNEKERERQTWLREDDKVWQDDVGPAVASLGRPEDDDVEDIEAPADEWIRQPRQRRAKPQLPRVVPPRGYQAGR